MLSLIPKLERGQFEENVVIDVIFLNCPVFERIYNFPCTLSEAWLEGGKVLFSSAFNMAACSKVLYFRHNSAEYDEYEARMKSYFPDYEVIHAD